MIAERFDGTLARWLTLLGLVLVPLLVAGGFLYAGVNAQDRQKEVKAAVVNLDEPVTVDGQYTPLGRQLTANLVDSRREQNLTWVLDTEAKAREGLARGSYAAMVIIPENFSAAATSFAKDTSQAQQARIEVRTSPVTGLADATLGKVVATQAAAMLNQTLTKTYLENVYLGFNDLGEQFTSLADGSAKLAGGAEDLSSGIDEAASGAGQLSAGAGKLASGVGKFATGTTGLSRGLGKYRDGLESGAASASKAAQDLTGLLTAMSQAQASPEVVAYAVNNACPGSGADASNPGELAVKAQVCIGALTGAANALVGAAAGLDQKDPNTGESLMSGAKKLASNGRALASGADQLAEATDELASGLGQAGDGGAKLAEGMRDMADGIAKGEAELPSPTNPFERANLAQVVASPIDTDGLAGLADPNLGWVSLVLVLALWLGSLAVFAIIRPLGAGLLHSAEPTWLALARTMAPGLVVVLLQSLAVAAMAGPALNLTGSQWLAMAGLLVLSGVTFVVLNHALGAWFSGVGRLASLAVAVASAAPVLVAAAPTLFTAIRPFSPITPAMDALRLIGTGSPGVANAALTLVGWLLLGLGAGSVAVGRQRTTTLAAVVATS